PRLPAQGVLQPGKSLAGVRLGDTTAAVQQRWGRGYRLCRGCDAQTWFFTYPQGDPLGAGVAFRRGRVVAVFTLGSPLGWRTAEGLRLGESIERVRVLYGRNFARRLCIGYGALSMHRPGAVTSIFPSGE